MKRILALLIASAFLLTACGAPETTPETGIQDPGAESSVLMEPSEGVICEYSNLLEGDARQRVDTTLQEAGVSDSRREVFWNHVDQFNSAVDSSLLAADFVKGDVLSPTYDPYDYQEQWMEKYPDFGGYNCRITAFGLFGDKVSTAPEAEIRDRELFMDLESLESDPSALGEQDLDTFRRLYSTVPTSNSTDSAVHMEAILKDWEERGISFDEDNGLSLVTVWLHNQWSEEENELFIGHVGVLAETENGFYFVEKVAFQEPYQAIRLSHRGQLRDILMARYDVDWGQNTSKPIIMENKMLLQG